MVSVGCGAEKMKEHLPTKAETAEPVFGTSPSMECRLTRPAMKRSYLTKKKFNSNLKKYCLNFKFN